MVPRCCYDVLFVYVDLHIQIHAQEPWLRTYGSDPYEHLISDIIAVLTSITCITVEYPQNSENYAPPLARCPVYLMSAIATSNTEQKKETHIKCQPSSLGHKSYLRSLGKIKHVAPPSLHRLPRRVGDRNLAF